MIDRMTLQRLGLALLLPALAGAAAFAQVRADVASAPFAELERWASLVDAHAPGERDEAADEAGRLSVSQLDVVFDELQASRRLLERALDAREGLDRAVEWNHATLTVADLGARLRVPATELASAIASADRSTARQLVNLAVERLAERGAVLHADVAIVVPPVIRLVSAVEPAGKGSLLVQDGRAAGVERTAGSHATTHVRFGSRLVDLAAELDAPSDRTRAWYRATSAYLLRHEMYGDVMPHLDHARASLPDDPAILFYSGALHEVFALPRAQAVVQSVVLPPGMEHDVGSVDDELRRADVFYRRALELDPDFTLAAVHHGRVIDLVGNHQAALSTLTRVRSSVADRPTEYFVELFLGDASRNVGEFDAARDHYARAAALYPRARTPGLAQSALLRARGDRAGAVAAVRELLGRRVGRSLTDDPWWTYYMAHVADAETLLSDMRTVLSTGGAR